MPFKKLPTTLEAWIQAISQINPQTIQLGLERIAAVAGDLKNIDCPVITVAGTNGKGTTVFALEAIYKASGYRTGLFSSPFLFHYTEQVRINGQACLDREYCQAFSAIEAKRGDIILTPFEYLTLAALYLFKRQPLDVIILEVGLGGRLDAVNIVNPDVAVITNISLDHMEYLGDTREKIAAEKAGILRLSKPFVYAEKNIPLNLIDIAKHKKAPLFLLGKDFYYDIHSKDTWSWISDVGRYEHLPQTPLHPDNIAGALMAIQLMQPWLPISLENICQGIKNINLPGRVEVIQGHVTFILDVSHNPASIAYLAEQLLKIKIIGKIKAVFSMVADKDIQSSLQVIQSQVDEWYIAPIQHPRANSLEALKKAFSQVKAVHYFVDLKQAFHAAHAKSISGDAIVIFGSFHTVAEVYAVIKEMH